MLSFLPSYYQISLDLTSPCSDPVSSFSPAVKFLKQVVCACCSFHFLLDPFQPTLTSMLLNATLSSLFSSYFMSKIGHRWSHFPSLPLNLVFLLPHWEPFSVSCIGPSCTPQPSELGVPPGHSVWSSLPTLTSTHKLNASMVAAKVEDLKRI